MTKKIKSAAQAWADHITKSPLQEPTLEMRALVADFDEKQLTEFSGMTAALILERGDEFVKNAQDEISHLEADA